MEKPVSGTIEFEGVTYSRAIQRFVEKRIHKWLSIQPEAGDAGKAGEDRDPAQAAGNPKYLVTFRRQGPGHTINCNLEIRMGEETWVSFRYGSGPHQALVQCLEHLSRTRGRSVAYTFAPDAFEARRRKVVMIPASL